MGLTKTGRAYTEYDDRSMRLGNFLYKTFPEATFLCVTPQWFMRKPGMKFVPGGGGVILPTSVIVRYDITRYLRIRVLLLYAVKVLRYYDRLGAFLSLSSYNCRK